MNPFDISLLASLKDRDYAREGLMVLESRIVIEKAAENGAEIVGILRSDDSAEDWLAPVAARFPVQAMSHEALCDLVGFKFHHGAIGIARRPVLAEFRTEDAGDGAYLCLWGVADPSNVGALIRSAAGLGADGVILGEGCADPFYRKSLRASMGNALSLPLFSCEEKGFLELARSGMRLIAAALSAAAIPVREFKPARPLVLAVGNEGFGLPPAILSACESHVLIPMRPDIDSLNVVVAGSICMYELFRRQ
jgi:tRNA G18 (ribose-2'-O)-methylase SpoU